jgi:hypothetical protein
MTGPDRKVLPMYPVYFVTDVSGWTGIRDWEMCDCGEDANPWR